MRRDERTGRRIPARDDGSSLIEQLIAISVITAVLLGLLASLGATATSISTGRQRTIAVSLAKQAIENLQGAAYTDVATNLASDGLSSDPLVTPDFRFEGEPLVAGPSKPYRTTVDEAGTTFSLRTFVTAVTPVSADGVIRAGVSPYRRITLIIDWNTTGTPNESSQRTMRFSSLVFPLDYASYPASSGSAEAIGASVTLTGSLAGEEFGELRLTLPSTHTTTNTSTLRSSIASSAGSTSTIALLAGTVASTCPGYGDATGWECPHEIAASVADNDTGTNTEESEVKVDQAFSAVSISTLQGTRVLTPAGTMTSRATVADEADGLLTSQASLRASGGSVTFHVDDAFTGTLWELAGPWSQSAEVDHDADGGGMVTASAHLTTPVARVFDLASGIGAPDTFDGAVRVSGFTASASVTGGYPPFGGPTATRCAPTATICSPTATAGPLTLEIWDGLPGYRTVDVTPGTSSLPVTAGFDVGTRNVMFTSTVESQSTTTSTTDTTSPTGVSLRSHGVAQHPSLLLVTVDVTVTTGDAVPEKFTIVFDYGRVSASAHWLVKPL